MLGVPAWPGRLVGAHGTVPVGVVSLLAAHSPALSSHHVRLISVAVTPLPRPRPPHASVQRASQ